MYLSTLLLLLPATVMALPTGPLAPASADAIASRNSLDWKRDIAEDAAKIYSKRAEAEDAANKYWLGDAAKTNGKRAEAEDAADKYWLGDAAKSSN